MIETPRETPPETMDERDARWRKLMPECYPADALFDDTHAMMSQQSFDELPEYSATVPTGVVPGKCWKRKCMDSWLVGRYDPKNETHVTTVFRIPIIA